MLGGPPPFRVRDQQGEDLNSGHGEMLGRRQGRRPHTAGSGTSSGAGSVFSSSGFAGRASTTVTSLIGSLTVTESPNGAGRPPVSAGSTLAGQLQSKQAHVGKQPSRPLSYSAFPAPSTTSLRFQTQPTRAMKTASPFIIRGGRKYLDIPPSVLPYPLSWDRDILDLQTMDHLDLFRLKGGVGSIIDFKGQAPSNVLDLGCGVCAPHRHSTCARADQSHRPAVSQNHQHYPDLLAAHSPSLAPSLDPRCCYPVACAYCPLFTNIIAHVLIILLITTGRKFRAYYSLCPVSGGSRPSAHHAALLWCCLQVGFDIAPIQLNLHLTNPKLAARVRWVHGNLCVTPPPACGISFTLPHSLTDRLPFAGSSTTCLCAQLFHGALTKRHTDGEFDHVNIRYIARGVPEDKVSAIFIRNARTDAHLPRCKSVGRLVRGTARLLRSLHLATISHPNVGGSPRALPWRLTRNDGRR